ncbi:MAG: hypothetical protein MJZ12_03825 [Prevotella sp.]|nr:hypothetical protein [Prevotella sp.]
MKKIITIAICALTLFSCQDKRNATVEADTTERDSLLRVINQKDNEMNDMLATFNEIQEGFRLINAAEGKVAVIKDGESTNKSELLRENMLSIKQAMEHNRDLISKLRQQIRESSLKSDQMKATLDNLLAELKEKDEQLRNLQSELERKDIHIAELDQAVLDLNQDISSLKEESSSKTQTINTQDKMLNTAWYVFGTKKELQDQSIYIKGKVLQSNFNKNYFTKIDIRVDKEIKLYSKSAQMLTSHPAGSYSLQQDANKQYILRITNPQTFWSTSKYLVILVK